MNTNEGDVSWPSITDIQRKLFLGAGVAMQIKAMYAPSIQSIEQQRDDLRAQVKRLQRAIHEATNIGIHVASMNIQQAISDIQRLKRDKPDGWRRRVQQLAHIIANKDDSAYVPPEEGKFDEMIGRKTMPHCWNYADMAREGDTL